MAILKLGSITTIPDGVKIGSIMLGSNAIGASVTVAADTAKSINLNNGSDKKNYGSLNIDKDGNLSLRVSSLDGEVELANSDDATAQGTKALEKLTSVSFTSTKGVQTTLDTDNTLKTLKTATFGSGKDSVSVTGTLGEDFVLNTGAGKDVISLSASNVDENAKIIAGAGDDIVIVGGSASYGNVALGAGKDTVKFSANNATVKLTDYKYNEDVIISSAGQATLTNDGTLKLGASGDSVVSGIAASNNLYLAKVNKDANTTMYATAAEDSAKVDVNASSVKDKNVVINTTSADSATITTGKATLTAVTLNTAEDSANTIKIGDASAKNSVDVTGFNGDDVLSFTGLSFAKTTIGLDNNSDATLTNGKVSLNLGKDVTVAAVKADNSSHDKAAVKFNLNDKTLYATTTDDQVIDLTEEEDITKVLVAGQNVLADNKYSGIKTSAQLVDLGSSNFHNINMVVLTEDTAAKASVIGTNKTKTGVTIDASAAADGVAVWANNSSTSKGDTIVFGGANDVADTLWLGSADGNDTVSGFDFESDVLYLADANSMKVEGGVIKVGKSKMTVSLATSDIMQVQGAKFAGTYYVAGDFNNTGNVQLGENAGQANYYAVGKKAAVEINPEMTDTYTFLKDIDYAGASKANIAAGGSVASINAATTSEDAKVIVEGVANVTVGAGTNEVWVNGAAATGNVELGSGADKVWFGASDKIVKVNNYDADSDVIALLGNTMDYKAKKDNGDVVITAGTSKLKVTTTSEFLNVVDSTGAAYKVYAGTATDTANYTTNTESRNIFVGIGTLTNDGTIDENTTLVVNGANNQWGLQSAAVVDKSVKTIDMSGSSADFTLVGSSTVNNTITGGTGTNYLNGGGASKDTLNGVTGAVDNFYYGKGDGDDTLVNVEADDFVQLYNVSAADIATIKADDPSNVVITMNDKSKLTINGLTDGATFVLTDGVYTYDSTAEGSKFTKL